MVDLEAIQSVYYMVAATGVLGAAAYYVLNMSARGGLQPDKHIFLNKFLNP
jgi:hypothetical protein